MISRRLLLQATALLLLPGCHTREADLPDTSAFDATLLSSLRPLAAVGEALPADSRIAMAHAAHPLLEQLSNAQQNERETLLLLAIRQDFQAGRTCEVKGWKLSVTECGVAALVHEAIGQGQLVGLSPSSGQARFREDTITNVRNWGPQTTTVGTPFNVQRDGHSGLWIVTEDAPPYVKVALGGITTPANVRSGVVTTGLYAPEHEALLNAPGGFEVALVDPVREVRQRVGEFVVKPQPRPTGLADLCDIETWGPQRTRAGVAANPQPNGSMGLWFRTECVPKGIKIFFGEDQLRLTQRPFGFTSSIPLALLEARGRIPLTLRVSDGSHQVIGNVIID